MAALSLAPPDGSRDRRVEDPTNLWVVHLAGRLLLPLALTLRIPANAISILGLLFGVASAAAFSRWDDWRLASLGLLLCIAWMIADGLDGMVARVTGTASAFGRALDGLCDHGVFLLLYLSLATSVGTAQGWFLALGAGAAHAMQATLYEGERARFHRRIRGDPGGRSAPASRNILVRWYDKVAGSFDRMARPFDALLKRSPDPQRLGKIYGRKAVPPLKLMIPLSNNMRVIAIYVACLAGDPRLFWLVELLPLTLITVWGIAWHRRIEAGLMSQYDRPNQERA